MSLGFVFPGQGSQFVGMLSDVAAAHGSVRERFAEAGDAIGIDLWRIVTDGPDTELAATAVTQPALLTASVALWDVWLAEGGPQPALMAGHSLGEYSALTCAGALAFTDAVRLVRRRGELMQEAVPQGEGAMAAILSLDDEAIDAACAAADGLVSPANYNAPGQTVIAGTTQAVEQAVASCRERGARKAVMLDVSGPFHCALMAPAREQLAEALDGVPLSPPRIPVVHNVDAEIAATVEGIERRLLAQLSEPVRWIECVQRLAAGGVSHLVECGPGKVLSGLTRRIDRALTAGTLSTLDGLADQLEAAAA